MSSAAVGRPCRAVARPGPPARGPAELDAPHVESLLGLADTYLRHGDLERARVLLEGLVTLAPSSPLPLLGAAIVLDRLGRSEEALARLSALERLAPGDPRADELRAEIALGRGDRRQAALHLRSAAAKAGAAPVGEGGVWAACAERVAARRRLLGVLPSEEGAR